MQKALDFPSVHIEATTSPQQCSQWGLCLEGGCVSVGEETMASRPERGGDTAPHPLLSSPISGSPRVRGPTSSVRRMRPTTLTSHSPLPPRTAHSSSLVPPGYKPGIPPERLPSFFFPADLGRDLGHSSSGSTVTSRTHSTFPGYEEGTGRVCVGGHQLSPLLEP